MPEHAPSWLRDSVALFRTEDLGCHFTSVLAALVRLETAFGFDEKAYSVMAAEHRPIQINQWIKAGVAASRPEGNWLAGGDATYGEDDAWGRLDNPGPNGCLSIVAGLYFWGVHKPQTDDGREQWARAVQDVGWMLEGLAESMKKTKPHT
ncbi:hypothetical protein B0H13DRAFT_2366911 [Mycena leptocephala]|nr:hypothetical protein B0H13DRAFT_2366911 [Mycena leptocephala]